MDKPSVMGVKQLQPVSLFPKRTSVAVFILAPSSVFADEVRAIRSWLRAFGTPPEAGAPKKKRSLPFFIERGGSC